jgi:hypothetical protein
LLTQQNTLLFSCFACFGAPYLNDVEGENKESKNVFMKMAIFGGGGQKNGKKLYFDSKSPLLDVGGFAKQGIKNIRLSWISLYKKSLV